MDSFTISYFLGNYLKEIKISILFSKLFALKTRVARVSSAHKRREFLELGGFISKLLLGEDFSVFFIYHKRPLSSTDDTKVISGLYASPKRIDAPHPFHSNLFDKLSFI
jgi:hypothetical protein